MLAISSIKLKICTLIGKNIYIAEAPQLHDLHTIMLIIIIIIERRYIYILRAYSVSLGVSARNSRNDSALITPRYVGYVYTAKVAQPESKSTCMVVHPLVIHPHINHCKFCNNQKHHCIGCSIAICAIIRLIIAITAIIHKSNE